MLMVIPFSTSLSQQPSARHHSVRVTAKSGTRCVALLGIGSQPRPAAVRLVQRRSVGPQNVQRRRTQARDREQWRCYGFLHCVAILAQRYASHPDFACNAPHKGLIQRFHNGHLDPQDTEALPLPRILAGARVENKRGLFVSGTDCVKTHRSV
jgi:hypothetical protein